MRFDGFDTIKLKAVLFIGAESDLSGAWGSCLAR